MDKEKLFNAKTTHANSEPKPMSGAHIRPIYLTSPFIVENARKSNKAEPGDTGVKINTNVRYIDPMSNVIRHILLKMINLRE